VTVDSIANVSIAAFIAVAALVAAIAAVLMALKLRKRADDHAGRLDSLENASGRVEQQSKRALDEANAVRRTAAEAERRVTEIAEAVQRAEGDVAAAVERLAQFEEYFRTVFEKQLRDAFGSFDKSVVSVLDAMQTELRQGLDRIEEIRSVVESRTKAEKRLIETGEEVHKQIEGKTEDTQPTPEQAAPAQPPADEATETEPPPLFNLDDDEEPGLQLKEPDSDQT